MLKPLTYPESRPMRWLSIMLLSLSCFAFSLSPVASKIQQSQPTQIEQVVSTGDEGQESQVSYHQVFADIFFLHPDVRSRDYERNLIFSYQAEINVRFQSVSEEQYAFQKPDHFQALKIAPLNSDEDPLLS